MNDAREDNFMKIKTTYILIDTSGSMHDCQVHSRASAVNLAMREVMVDVLPRIITEKDAEYEPNIAVLTFSSYGIDWHISKTKMEDVAGDWMDISRFSGATSVGEAIKMVIEDINMGCYGEPNPDEIAPTIILMSHGEFDGTDKVSYEEALDYANPNNPNFCRTFKYANRIAIGIQPDNNGINLLKKFGRTSASLSAVGVQPYYDCTDVKTDTLIRVMESPFSLIV